jgi:hypothetical protein
VPPIPCQTRPRRHYPNGIIRAPRILNPSPVCFAVARSRDRSCDTSRKATLRNTFPPPAKLGRVARSAGWGLSARERFMTWSDIAAYRLDGPPLRDPTRPFGPPSPASLAEGDSVPDVPTTPGRDIPPTWPRKYPQTAATSLSRRRHSALAIDAKSSYNVPNRSRRRSPLFEEVNRDIRAFSKPWRGPAGTVRRPAVVRNRPPTAASVAAKAQGPGRRAGVMRFRYGAGFRG